MAASPWVTILCFHIKSQPSKQRGEGSRCKTNPWEGLAFAFPVPWLSWFCSPVSPSIYIRMNLLLFLQGVRNSQVSWLGDGKPGWGIPSEPWVGNASLKALVVTEAMPTICLVIPTRCQSPQEASLSSESPVVPWRGSWRAGFRTSIFHKLFSCTSPRGIPSVGGSQLCQGAVAMVPMTEHFHHLFHVSGFRSLAMPVPLPCFVSCAVLGRLSI